MPLIVLSLLTVAGTHRKNRPNIFYTGVVGDLDFPGMGFFATPTARTIVSRVNTFKGGVQHRNKHYLPPRTKYFFYRGYTSNDLGAWATGHTLSRTVFYPPARLPRGGGDCTYICTGAESLQRLRQQRQHGNGARITKNNAGRGTPSTPQARPSDVKRRFTHRDFSRPVICAGAICHYPEMKKRGGERGAPYHGRHSSAV